MSVRNHLQICRFRVLHPIVLVRGLCLSVNGTIASCPIIGRDGTVYVGSSDSNVYAFNGLTGVLKWTFLTGGPISGAPAIGADGTLYVTSMDSYIYALNSATGAKNWSYKTPQWIYSSPAIGPDNSVCVMSSNGEMYALQGSTGVICGLSPQAKITASHPRPLGQTEPFTFPTMK